MSEIKDKLILEVRTYCHILGLESNLENSIDALIKAGFICDKKTKPANLHPALENSNFNDKLLKQASLAGMESFEYAERTCVPYEDCFDQWIEHMEQLERGEA